MTLPSSFIFRNGPKQDDSNIDELIAWWTENAMDTISSIEASDCATYHASHSCLIASIRNGDEVVELRNYDVLGIRDNKVVVVAAKG